MDRVDFDGAVAHVEALLDSGMKRQCVLAMNPEKVMRLKGDPALFEFVSGAALLIPDGYGVVLAAKILGLPSLTLVTGVDLMVRLARLAESRGFGVFLFGGTEEANRGAAESLARTMPALKISGRRNGYFDQGKEHEVVALINQCRPDMLFVALGSPRQEAWMRRFLPQLDVGICQGVGGTFDVLGGVARRAPKAVQRLRLEWLYRLLADPSRAKRQAALPRFAAEVLRERLRTL